MSRVLLGFTVPDGEPVQLAYLAGLIDGEGSVGIMRNKRNNLLMAHYHPYIQVCGTSERLMQWVHSKFGGKFAKQTDSRTSKGFKQMYFVRWSYRKAYALAKELLPYLILKSEKAQVIVEWYENGAKPSGAMWRWYPDTIRKKQKELHEKMALLNERSQRRLPYA